MNITKFIKTGFNSQTLSIQPKEFFVRFYSSLSTPQHPSKKPNFPLKKKFGHIDSIKEVNKTRHSIFRATESLDRGLFKKAEDFAVSSIKDLMKKIDLSSSLYAYPTYALGLISLKKGYYSISESFLKDSLSRSEAIDGIDRNVKNIAESTNDLGLSLLRQGRFEESALYFFKAEKIAKDYNLDFLLPSIFSNIGEYYRELCYYDKSSNYHAKAHNYLLAFPKEQLNLARCCLNRGQVYRLSNQIEESGDFLNAGAKILTNYLNSIDSNPTPNHMDWTRFVIEFGHLYFSMGEIEKARQKFIIAKNHFISMNNSNIPDAIINMLNLAVLERNFPTLTPAQSNSYISDILASIQTPLQKLKGLKFNTRSPRIDSVIQNLVSNPIPTSSSPITSIDNNIKTTSAIKPKPTKVKLIEPLPFQLVLVENVPQLFQKSLI
ncbi:hypothetical protein RB653_005443 [Dictyostelium firmibasis]|uniref:Uncharacterized protein n=1 Tax=Dictyostelium firmibasis TaxID=79012 RepID=A0AAN7U9I2_9MYCE